VAEDVEIDVRGPFELREGDTFILCSDGLHGVVKEHELQEIAAGTIEEAADEFLRRALERGAPDNVTVIVARVEVTDEPPPGGVRTQDPTAGERFEDTQPLDPLDATPFDETVKETQKLKAVTPEELRDTDKIIAARPDEDTWRGNKQAPEVRRSSSVLRWMLVAVLLLGAAGAWYFWSHQQTVSSSPSR
jgi:hypothetical protein